MVRHAGKWWRRLTTGKKPIKRYAAEAGSWYTCAVGEAREGPLREFIEIRPVIFGGGPADSALFNLGEEFARAIRAGTRPRARQIYRQIMARVDQLATRDDDTTKPDYRRATAVGGRGSIIGPYKRHLTQEKRLQMGNAIHASL